MEDTESKRIGAKAYRIAKTFGLSKEDAEEIAQDVIAKAISKEGKIIVRYLTIDAIRKKYGDNRTARPSEIKRSSLISLDQCEEMTTIDLIAANENAIDFYNISQEFSPEDRIISRLIYYWKFTQREIAKLLGVTEGAVTQRMRRLIRNITEKKT